MANKFRRFFTVTASLCIVVAMMFVMTACNEKEDSSEKSGAVTDATGAPMATTTPGTDYTLEISGPDELEEGTTVKYTVRLSECDVEDGLIGLDFSVEYNTDLLTFKDAEMTVYPSDSWEQWNKADSDSIQTFACLDDNIETPITGPDQFEVVMSFEVKAETSENKNIVSLMNVLGAINDENVSDAFGSGNSIALK